MCVVRARRSSQVSFGPWFQAIQHIHCTALHCTFCLIVAVASFSFSPLIFSNLFSSLQRISERDLLPSSGGHVSVAGGRLPFVGEGKPVHGRPGGGAKYFGADDHGNSNCRADFSCIIPDILSSPAIPGNIADIVELLKKISLLLSENVNRKKMQVFTFMGFRTCFWAYQSIHIMFCPYGHYPMKWWLLVTRRSPGKFPERAVFCCQRNCLTCSCMVKILCGIHFKNKIVFRNCCYRHGRAAQGRINFWSMAP